MISPEAQAAWANLMELRELAAGDWLLKAGDVATHCFFIEQGLVRELYINDRGVEHTRVFLAENQLTGSLMDLVSGQPSVTWIQALEPTRALAFPYIDFLGLFDDYPELVRMAWRFTEELYLRKARREWEMLALSARERHDAWRKEQPALDARISRQHLASYLGITPEHLSRLRAQTPGRPRSKRRAAR